MIVIMQPTASEQQVEHVKALISDMGLKPHPIFGTELTVVAAVGEDRKKDADALERAPGVDRVVRVLAPYKIAARETRPEPTIVRLNDRCVVGGTGFTIMAGPCSVEGEAQIVEVAKQVKRAGATALRGGAFKPRTNPYSFQGLGETGLKYLATAGEQTGLAVVTEVITPSEVELVAEYADCLQIGTRNAQNFRLLEACGRSGKPVLFKRGMSMTIDEFLQAAEYILASGNANVILCERGIRTFETYVRNTLPLAAIPELKHRTHLPVVVDPSQGTGHARLVPPMCKASLACGADGLLIEVHPDPEHALTDGAQSITPEALAETIDVMRKMAPALEREL